MHYAFSAQFGSGNGEKKIPLFTFLICFKIPRPTSDTLRLEFGHFSRLKHLSQPS